MIRLGAGSTNSKQEQYVVKKPQPSVLYQPPLGQVDSAKTNHKSFKGVHKAVRPPTTQIGSYIGTQGSQERAPFLPKPLVAG